MQPEYEHTIVAKNFFSHKSNMSFLVMSDDISKINDMIWNIRRGGRKLYVDYQDIADLNISVINIGPYGMDGHKRLELMEIAYSLEVVSNVTDIVLRRMLEAE